MANQEQKAGASGRKFTREMQVEKFRLFTFPPPNTAVVRYSIFDGENKQVYRRAMFHMPWQKTRFINLAEQELKLPPMEYEINFDGVSSSGLKVNPKVSVFFETKDLEDTVQVTEDDVNTTISGKNIGDRWRSFLRGIKNHPVGTALKTVAGLGAVVGASIIGTPATGAIVAGALLGGTAIHATFLHQDPEWVKAQAPIKKVTQDSKVAASRMAAIIQEALIQHYSTNNFEDIKGRGIDLSNPDFARIQERLEEYEEKFGIRVVRVTIEADNLSAESEKIISGRKTATIEAEKIRKVGEAKAAAVSAQNEPLQELVRNLRAQGMSEEAIIQALQAQLVGNNPNATVFLGQSNVPLTMPIPRREPVTEEENADEHSGPRR